MRAIAILASLALLALVGAQPAFALDDGDGLGEAGATGALDGGGTSSSEGEPSEPAPLPIGADDEAGGVTTAQQGPDETDLAGRELVGVFELDEGECEGPGGSYFRMVQPDGEPGEGPYVSNADSPCDDNTVTPLRPGTDGGLSTEEHQPHPDPAFSASGGGLADRIVQPQQFFGVDFAAATNPTDPQTEIETPEPVITHDGDGNLEGDVRAFGVAWNRQHFNQGAPKPDGNTDGRTEVPTGTYDEDTGAFSLSWTSEIEGGPFDGFTGEWHLEGAFAPAAGHAGAQGTTGADEGDDDAGGATDEDADGATEDASATAAADTDGDGDAAADTDGGGDAAAASTVDGGATGDGGGALPRTGPGTPPLLGLGLLLAGSLLLRGGGRRAASTTVPGAGPG